MKNAKFYEDEVYIQSVFLEIYQGDVQKRNDFIWQNRNYVMWIINTYFSGAKIPLEDLFQIGMIGLTKCVDNFDISRSLNFSGCALKYVQNEILMFLRSSKKSQSEIGYNDFCPNEEIDDTELFEDYNHNIAEDYELQEKRIKLRSLLSYLDEVERKIIISRYWHFETQVSIAKEINKSQPVVSRIERRALQKLKDLLEGKSITEDVVAESPEPEDNKEERAWLEQKPNIVINMDFFVSEIRYLSNKIAKYDFDNLFECLTSKYSDAALIDVMERLLSDEERNNLLLIAHYLYMQEINMSLVLADYVRVLKERLTKDKELKRIREKKLEIHD